jgi:ADP-ribosylglycohydrolase
VTNIEHKVQGCILGLAIGDALGYPTEFMSLSQIHQQYGPNGIQDFEPSSDHPPGTFTDDTQMTIAVTEALIEAGHRDLDNLMRVMARRFVEWAESSDNDRAPGATCLSGCHNLKQGEHWRDAGIKDSKGCGSAMRSAPIGLFYRELDHTLEVACASSLLTHAHPTGVAAAAGAAIAVKLLLDGTKPEDLITHLIEITGHLDEDYKNKILQVNDVLPEAPADAMDIIGEAWIGEEAVASALYCFLNSPDNYAKTVLTGANTSGDSDSIACIAGGLSGVFNGIGKMPTSWVNRVEESERLRDLASRIVQEAATGQQ